MTTLRRRTFIVGGLAGAGAGVLVPRLANAIGYPFTLGVASGERVRIRIQEGRLARPGPTAIIRIVGVRAPHRRLDLEANRPPAHHGKPQRPNTRRD